MTSDLRKQIADLQDERDNHIQELARRDIIIDTLSNDLSEKELLLRDSNELLDDLTFQMDKYRESNTKKVNMSL